MTVPQRGGILAAYADLLPSPTPSLTLGEGATPLLYSARLSARLKAKVYLKLEGLNPTGSFKDRGMVVAVAQAARSGADTVICASTGNTSASAAAYAIAAGLDCVVLIPSGAIARGKLAQALMYGARVYQIDDNFDDALSLVRGLAADPKVAVVNSINPHRLTGQATAAYEIVDTLGDAPTIHALPVGNAGNISAYHAGFKTYHALGRTTHLPRLFGFQAAGAAPLVLGHTVTDPQTIATAIRIGNPASAHLAHTAIQESNGAIRAVTDDEILAAYHYLAQTGVFCEPASAAAVAGLLRYGVPADSVVTVTLTGNGLKDPDLAIDQTTPPTTLAATPQALRSVLQD